MSMSRWTGIVFICFALGGAASDTFAGGTLGGAPPPGGMMPGGDGSAPPPPELVITEFDWSSGFGNIFTFEGKVTGGDGSPITINFGNLPSMVNKTTPVNNGEFLFTIELTDDDYGLASAQAVNTRGQKSNVAYAYVYH